MPIANSGYVVEGPYNETGQASVEFKRAVDRARISLLVFNMAGVPPANVWLDQTEGKVPGTRLPKTAFSEAPMGDKVTHYGERGDENLVVQMGEICVTVRVSYAGTGTTAHPTSVIADGPGDKELLEGLARNVLARIFGRQLMATSDQTVAGATVTQARRTSEGVVMVPLNQWAQARGITLAENARVGTYAFSRNGTQFLLSLAAKSAKKGSAWQPLGGFVLRYSGVTYVPLSGVESLIQ